MQTDRLNGRIALVSLLTILRMPHTLADDSIFTNSQYPNDDYDLSSSGSLGDPFAEPFGNLPGSNGPKIDSNWAIDYAGLKLISNLQVGNAESLLMADASTSIPCPKRRGKRSQNEQNSCKSPYSETITKTPPPKPEAQEGESGGEGDQAPDSEGNQAPDGWQGSRPWPKLDETSGQNILWLQLRSARGVEAEGNLRVCNKQGMYPICYPYKYPGVRPLVDPAPIVEPCRFCKLINFSSRLKSVLSPQGKIDLKRILIFYFIIGNFFFPRRAAK